ncbi:hypothetical protein ACFZB9_21660 [Kitasatospora sp. NPDC008050]|uniref:hypothetical protein n=1 Tax=Kitasatospora sp. NPDC008050 TaxID=3364021 RepID=UPI0036E68C17
MSAIIRTRLSAFALLALLVAGAGAAAGPGLVEAGHHGAWPAGTGHHGLISQAAAAPTSGTPTNNPNDNGWW